MRLILHSFSLVWKHVDSGDNSWLVNGDANFLVICDHLWAPSCQIFSLRARLREQDCLWSNTPTMDAFAPHRIIASLQQLISFVCE